jgi:hypothetical protein
MWNDKRKFIKQLAEKEQEAANIGNIKELYEKNFYHKGSRYTLSW